jgi:hypothetical protein
MEIGALHIRWGWFIDQLQVVYRNPTNGHVVSGPVHGGNGGQLTVITLNAGEFIAEINGRTGSFVDSLLVKTNQGRIFSNLGGDGGPNPFRFHLGVGSGEEIFGFFGRSGQFLDAIGVHTRPHP